MNAVSLAPGRAARSAHVLERAVGLLQVDLEVVVVGRGPVEADLQQAHVSELGDRELLVDVCRPAASPRCSPTSACGTGVSATPRIRCSAMIGRVDGFTCHSNVPDAGSSSTCRACRGTGSSGPGWPDRSRPRRASRRRSTSCARGDVSVTNALRRRSCAPGGPEPAITECLVASAAFSIARKNASRLPLPAYAPAPAVLADVLLERRVELVEADLEREAEAAGRVVAPVLGRAGRVVEAVGRLVQCSRSGAPCARRGRCRCPRPAAGPGRAARAGAARGC